MALRPCVPITNQIDLLVLGVLNNQPRRGIRRQDEQLGRRPAALTPDKPLELLSREGIDLALDIQNGWATGHLDAERGRDHVLRHVKHMKRGSECVRHCPSVRKSGACRFSKIGRHENTFERHHDRPSNETEKGNPHAMAHPIAR
jgi:hypothetical protein